MRVERAAHDLAGDVRLKARRICGAAGMVALVVLACSSPQLASARGASSRVLAPLPASDYSARSVCPPPTPGRASCLARELVPETTAARAHSHPLGIALSVPAGASEAAEACEAPHAAEGCFGLRPQDLHSAYALPTSAQSPQQQTIALVDAYNDPSAEKDLAVYDEEFHLPACTAANGCFSKVNQNGASKPLPAKNGEWAEEISLDVEVAHAICQNCHILLVEAQSDSFEDLETAENRAATMGATEISNSWYGGEPITDSTAFEHPGTVITAADGDEGYLNWDAEEEDERGFLAYPASSPHVVAVGGTRLTLNSPSDSWESETVWNGYGATGGGCSQRFTAPAWQRELPDWSSVGCGSTRAVADIAADADPYTGAAVYDSTADRGEVLDWVPIGGTSLASPLIAATFALAGGAGGVEYPARTLYENAVTIPASLHDVESGSNGECTKPYSSEGLSGCTVLAEGASCAGKAICVAGPGYDGPSGLGSPNGLGAFEPAAAPVRQAQVIAFTSSAPGTASVGGATYTVTATASSGLAVSLSSGTPSVCTLAGSTVSFTAAGTCTIDANQSGDPEYEPAPEAQQSFAVGNAPPKLSQVIAFTSSAPGTASVGGATYTVTATASSGLAVSLSSGTPSVCTLAGSTVSFTAAGTCTIDANQSGDREYEPAPEAQQSFAVASPSSPAGSVAGSSSTLAFTSSLTLASTPASTATPSSAFRLIGNPIVNRYTGAITFTASVGDPGTFSWLLTFAVARPDPLQASRTKCHRGQVELNGRCRPAKIVFGRGDRAVAAAATLAFTVEPSAAATRALGNDLRTGRGLPVSATITFRSSLGATPALHKRSISVRLRTIGHGKR